LIPFTYHKLELLFWFHNVTVDILVDNADTSNWIIPLDSGYNDSIGLCFPITSSTFHLPRTEASPSVASAAPAAPKEGHFLDRNVSSHALNITELAKQRDCMMLRTGQ
jgi:hypothetical protein